jgi:hypothetical protein
VAEHGRGRSIAVERITVRGAAPGASHTSWRGVFSAALESAAADLAGEGGPIAVPRLRVRVRAGARAEEVAQAVAAAIERASRGGRP